MINRELIRLKVVQLMYSYYRNEGKTLEIAEKELTFSLEKAYELYESLLWLLVDLRNYAETKDSVRIAREKRTGEETAGIVADKQFAENRFLKQLATNKTLLDFKENQKSDWNGEDAFIKKLYARIVESDFFNEYLEHGDFSYESDRELIRKAYKTFVCNNEDFESLIEDVSLYWNDDKFIIDSFVLKTIKRFKEDDKDGGEILPMYAAEEDRRFATALFSTSIERGEELREIIRQNTKNWEFNRLAFMDVIVMQIALAEILTFDRIPLNVTFNEYLDIAKVYSTPRSASYINGMLDSIVKQLHEEGRTEKVRVNRESKKG